MHKGVVALVSNFERVEELLFAEVLLSQISLRLPSMKLQALYTSYDYRNEGFCQVVKVYKGRK